MKKRIANINDNDDTKKQNNKIFFEEVDNIIQQTIKGYVTRAVYDENDKDKGSIFIVKHERSSLKMRCSSKTETFDQVIQIAASYFGYSSDLVFLSDQPEKGCIYLGQQRVFDHIFPLKTAKKVNHMPELYLVLRRNMTAQDVVDNEKTLRDETKKEVQQQDAELEAQDKKQREEEEARMKLLKHQKKMNKYRKKFERKQCLIGFINFVMIIGLLAALLNSTETFSRNLESL